MPKEMHEPHAGAQSPASSRPAKHLFSAVDLRLFLFFWGTVLSGIIGMVLAVPPPAFFVTIWSEIKASLKQALSNAPDPCHSYRETET